MKKPIIETALLCLISLRNGLKQQQYRMFAYDERISTINPE